MPVTLMTRVPLTGLNQCSPWTRTPGGGGDPLGPLWWNATINATAPPMSAAKTAPPAAMSWPWITVLPPPLPLMAGAPSPVAAGPAEAEPGCARWPC